MVLSRAQQQVEKGDNPDEKPMWAHHGGLDFDGRERWEKWDACKVGPPVVSWLSQGNQAAVTFFSCGFLTSCSSKANLQ